MGNDVVSVHDVQTLHALNETLFTTVTKRKLVQSQCSGMLLPM